MGLVGVMGFVRVMGFMGLMGFMGFYGVYEGVVRSGRVKEGWGFMGIYGGSGVSKGDAVCGV